MNPPDRPPGTARNDDTGPEAPSAHEARMLILGGVFLLFVGLFTAVFSDNRISLFLGIALAVTGALMALPQMVAAAVSRR